MSSFWYFTWTHDGNFGSGVAKVDGPEFPLHGVNMNLLRANKGPSVILSFQAISEAQWMNMNQFGTTMAEMDKKPAAEVLSICRLVDKKEKTVDDAPPAS